VEAVLVRWYIDAARVDAFLEKREPVAPDVPGFVSEALYRLKEQPEAGCVVFVTVGQWESQQAFYAHFEAIPEPDMHELRPRETTWLLPAGALG
jgi:heme-degrading monooxygenase HmoA